MKRAVINVRVSTSEQAEKGYSIPSQLEACRRYATEHNFEVVEETADDCSGAIPMAERPGGARVYELLKTRQIDAVIQYTIDRAARDDREYPIEYLIFLRDVQDAGAELHFVDTGKSDGGIVDLFRAYQAADERRKIRERTMRGRRAKVKAGHVIVHGRPPYGYELGEKDGRRVLIPYEPEARIVRQIYQWYAAGDEANSPMTIYAIAERLKGDGVPTRGDVSDIVHKKNRRGVWRKAVVSQILHNETYSGTWYYGKQRRVNGKLIDNPREAWIPVKVPAIVDRDTWEQVQALLSENKAARRVIKYNYLLRRRVFCGECGTAMGTKTNRPKGETIGYYRCPVQPGTLDYARACTMKTHFRTDWVDAIVWGWVCGLFGNREVFMQGLRREQERREEANRPLCDRLAVIDDLLADNRAKLERLLDLYLAGDFPREMVVERKETLEKTVANLEHEQARLTARLEAALLTDEQIETLVAIMEEVGEGLDLATADFEKRRWIIEKLNVKARLAVEEGQRVAHVECYAGYETLSIASSTS
jgi:site-specific DNA recombinase